MRCARNDERYSPLRGLWARSLDAPLKPSHTTDCIVGYDAQSCALGEGGRAVTGRRSLLIAHPALIFC